LTKGDQIKNNKKQQGRHTLNTPFLPKKHIPSLIPMPIYVYETVPEKADQKPTQFEVVQRMTDEAFTKHPDTGEPVRRIISGGISLPVSSKGGDCCDSGCSCG
jgi:predicted nucleic acid-binding Zn ribbon protein